MLTQIAYVTIIVRDQDEALAWYTEKFGLEKRVDVRGKARWLSVGVPGQPCPEIALQAPSVVEHGEEGYARKLGQVGNGTTWVLHVDDCKRTVDEFRSRGVRVLEDPVTSPWGVSALVADLYGNLFSLVQRG